MDTCCRGAGGGTVCAKVGAVRVRKSNTQTVRWTKAVKRARPVPSPACGGGLGRGPGGRLKACGRGPPPRPPPRGGGGGGGGPGGRLKACGRAPSPDPSPASGRGETPCVRVKI